MEVEDDAFFADLSKRIALLIMDDDGGEGSPAQRPALPLQGFPYMSQTIMPPPPPPPPPYGYEVAYRRESRGTGVFIPRPTLPRRKNKSGGSTPVNTNSNKQPNKPGAAVSGAVSNNHAIYSSYYSNRAVLERHK